MGAHFCRNDRLVIDQVHAKYVSGLTLLFGILSSLLPRLKGASSVNEESAPTSSGMGVARISIRKETASRRDLMINILERGVWVER